MNRTLEGKEVRHRRMLFLKKVKKLKLRKSKKERPLQTQKSVILFCSPVGHKRHFSKNPLALKSLFLRRASLCVSPGTEGSMTVEASLVLPFFLMIILSLLSFMEIIRLQNGLTMALREAGMPMSVYAYAYDYVREGGKVDLTGVLPNLALSYGYAGYKVKEFLGEEYLETAPLAYGANSIQYHKSSILEKDDVIDLVALYAVEPDFNVSFLPSINLISRYYGRAWTGYKVDGQIEETPTEINVYITPQGTVYHRSRFCTHLQLTIVSCSVEELQGKRNEGGARYRACLLCGGGMQLGKVYITSDGDCYHRSVKCSGLKRTVDIVPISQVGNRGKCSRCGG